MLWTRNSSICTLLYIVKCIVCTPYVTAGWDDSHHGHVFQSKSLHERMGATMKKAGSAITITSVTDFLAFMIGK